MIGTGSCPEELNKPKSTVHHEKRKIHRGRQYLSRALKLSHPCVYEDGSLSIILCRVAQIRLPFGLLIHVSTVCTTTSHQTTLPTTATSCLVNVCSPALKSINHASVLYQTSQPEGFCLNPSHSSASRHFELLVVHISLDARVFSPVSCYSGPRRADGLFASSQARFRRP